MYRKVPKPVCTQRRIFDPVYTRTKVSGIGVNPRHFLTGVAVYMISTNPKQVYDGYIDTFKLGISNVF